MDGVKGCLDDKGLAIPEANECAKDRREWKCVVGGDVDDLGLSGLYETVKAANVLICFALGVDLSKG